MSAPNGHSSDVAGKNHANGVDQSGSPFPLLPASSTSRFAPDQIKELLMALEVPFDPSVIQWRVTNTARNQEPPRGQVIPYAGQRAYTDRLNALVTPSGWTRKYTVNTSANFQRGKDEKVVAKVFVTCDLTIYGLGTHSATGEEWADDDNAGTSAEAQAFKRACSCFGLGRYLYHFTGVWVDLDDRKRPMTAPILFGWATPEGWRSGLRPSAADGTPSTKSNARAESGGTNGPQQANNGGPPNAELLQKIQQMQAPIGKRLFRGLLKSVGRVWNPKDVHDRATQERILEHMQAAERGWRRVDAALERVGDGPLKEILRSLNLSSVDQVENLDTLKRIVEALEAKVGTGRSTA